MGSVAAADVAGQLLRQHAGDAGDRESPGRLGGDRGRWSHMRSRLCEVMWERTCWNSASLRPVVDRGSNGYMSGRGFTGC